MMGRIRWTPETAAEIPNGQYHMNIREPRMGIMLHFDASSTDAGALAWFRDPRCRVSYHRLVLDDGRYGVIAPDSARAWHAGVCRSSDPGRLPYQDANSAFYGVAAATNGRVGVTAAQLLTIAWTCRAYFLAEGWSVDETWRIVGHETEAWPRGRKTDPTGPSRDHPILSVQDVRWLVPLFDVGEV